MGNTPKKEFFNPSPNNYIFLKHNVAEGLIRLKDASIDIQYMYLQHTAELKYHALFLAEIEDYNLHIGQLPPGAWRIYL